VGDKEVLRLGEIRVSALVLGGRGDSVLLVELVSGFGSEILVEVRVIVLSLEIFEVVELV
jgi:hypothetical protein